MHSVIRHLVFFCTLVIGLQPTLRAETPSSVGQWGIFEISLNGPADGNPFTEVRFSAVFTHMDQQREIEGFYDGEGLYRIRFMPETQGAWRYETKSNRRELTGKRGAFTVRPPEPGNHGPVRVRNTFHFAYADGTPFRQVGTTCYSWHHRPEDMEEQTLATLRSAPFNKLRMCVFPHDYEAKNCPPVYWPYEGSTPKSWDFSRFNPAFFQHLEQRVADLAELGIEADLILFHPYGGPWGFDQMSREDNERYVRYLVARLAAYRNVWWSVANEYDFIRTMTEEDMDQVFGTLVDADPYGHLRSIHNGFVLYDHNKPWVTHASIQNGAAVEDVRSAQLYRDVWRKPIVYDEVKYEGDFVSRWGQLSAREMVHRFWCGTVAGTYVGHSETFNRPDKLLWLGQGVSLFGESPARLAFLRKVMDDSPREGIEPVDKWQKPHIGGKAGEYYLLYFGHSAPTSWEFSLPKEALAEGMTFSVEILDTWNMTVTQVPGAFTTKKKDRYHFIDVEGRGVSLPGTEGIALRIRRLASDGQPVVVSAPPTE